MRATLLNTTLVLLTVLTGLGFTALGDHLANAQPASVTIQAAVVTPDVQPIAIQQAPSSDQQTLMAALMGEGMDYTSEQAEALAIAADLVCEGITAQAPMVEMGNFLVADYGLTDDEARHFITVIADTHC